MLHIPREADEVAPVGSIVLFFQMAFEPTMRVGGVKEVYLTPLQGTSRSYRSTLSIGLHAPHDASVNDIVPRAVARLAGQRPRRAG